MRFLGIDPGLNRTGWGIIEDTCGKLSYVSHGILITSPDDPISQRLLKIYDDLCEVLKTFSPNEAAVEEIFVNKNPVSSLKLGLARGIVLMVPAKYGISVQEYPSTTVKKALVGHGHAQKFQIAHMVHFFLPKVGNLPKDAADALAIAICHAHMRPKKLIHKGYL